MSSKVKVVVGGLLAMVIAGAIVGSFWYNIHDNSVEVDALGETNVPESHLSAPPTNKSSGEGKFTDSAECTPSTQATVVPSTQVAYYLAVRDFVKAKWVPIAVISVIVLAAVITATVVGVHVQALNEEEILRQQAEALELAKQQEQAELAKKLADQQNVVVHPPPDAGVFAIDKRNPFLYIGIVMSVLNIVALVVVALAHPGVQKFGIARKFVFVLPLIVLQQGILAIILAVFYGLFLLYARLLEHVKGKYPWLRRVLGVLGIIPATLATILSVFLLPAMMLFSYLSSNGMARMRRIATACSLIWKCLFGKATLSEVEESVKKINE